jgi:hypothetical protein
LAAAGGFTGKAHHLLRKALALTNLVFAEVRQTSYHKSTALELT